MSRLYNAIGGTYSRTRTADPAIVQALASFLAAQQSNRFLDLACGTGNYTSALADIGGIWYGCDISKRMIDQGRIKSGSIQWQVCEAGALPYCSDAFDGVICTLAIHHFCDLLRPFQEVHRVLMRGRFVLFTAFSEQMRNYWLCDYFPKMMNSASAQMPSRTSVTTALQSGGFEVEAIVPFYVRDDLQDLFLYSGKNRPTLYLDASIRANISSFASLCSRQELDGGIDRLRDDVASGRFAEVAGRYQSADGDYAFVVARKRAR